MTMTYCLSSSGAQPCTAIAIERRVQKGPGRVGSGRNNRFSPITYTGTLRALVLWGPAGTL